MTATRPTHLGRLTASFHESSRTVYLSAWPRTLTRPPWDTQLVLDHDAAAELVRSLAAALHYMGTSYDQLYPAADDLPDEAHITPGGP